MRVSWLQSRFGARSSRSLIASHSVAPYPLARGRLAPFCLVICVLSACLIDVPTADADDPIDAVGQKQNELRTLQQGIDAAAEKRKALADEISTLEHDRAGFQGTLIETTRKVYEDEGRVGDAEKRLGDLKDREDATKHSLQGRRVVIGAVLAALQRMGRKPPPALLVEPEDVLKAIRTSMLLGTLLPGMRTEADALVADLTKLSETRKEIEAERQSLDSELASLAGERTRLSTLIEARQASLGQARTDMDAERDKAAQLASQAGSLKDLIKRMEHESTAAGRAAEAARQSDEKLAAMLPSNPAKPDAPPFKDPARLAPSVAFISTKGFLPRPVSGTLLRHFGESDGLGGTEKGELSGTRENAIVAAPADSWVAYAGPYRTFGKILILNAGSGYYIVLAGMDRINVDLGQFVLAGEPIAVMGDGSTRTAAAIALGAAQPVLYVEFRKDGATIDPGPWWARPELQRVRG